MSDPTQFLIRGDLDIYTATDTANGVGSVKFHNSSATFTSLAETFLNKTNIDTTSGKLSVTGPNKAEILLSGGSGSIELTGSAASFLTTTGGALTVQAQAGLLTAEGTSVAINSTTTTIGLTAQTALNLTSTTGNIVGTSASAINLTANAASTFNVIGGGNLTNSSAGRVILSSTSSGNNAITLQASNASSGIVGTCGTSGLSLTSTGGGFTITGEHNSSTLGLTANGNGQNLLIDLAGAFNTSLVLNSAGTGASAIDLNATAATSGISASCGSGGLLLESTGGAFNITGQHTDSNITLTTNGAGQDLTLGLAGATASSLIVTSAGTSADAIVISATNAAGGINIDAGTTGITVDTTGGISLDAAGTSNITTTGNFNLTLESTLGQVLLRSGQAASNAISISSYNAAGGIVVSAGTAGLDMSSTGFVSIDAAGAASNFSLASAGAAQDLTIALTGATDSSLVLSSTGTSSVDAIILNASAGGINVDAAGAISIDTTDTSGGVSIATTTAGVPVTIGTSTSVTTIAGNLTVSGTTTTVNSETLTVTDNVILINSGIGELGNDAGTIIRRYQTANGTGAGDVVSDTATTTGAFQAGSATPGTLVLAAGSSSTTDFYKGWWIKVTSGTGNNQVRRIKSYNGTTKTATLYVTADNTSTFLDGLNLVTAPAAADTYSLYNSPFVATFYQESTDYWILATSNLEPDALGTVGISTINVQNYQKLKTGAIFIDGNGNNANSLLNVNFINSANSVGVTIEGVLIQGGLVGGSLPNVSEVILLPDNATTYVSLTLGGTRGALMVQVARVQASSGANSYLGVSGGSYAVFMLSSNNATNGDAQRLSAVKGSADERLDMRWNSASQPQLRHSPALTGGSGLSIPYRVTISKVVSN